MSLTLAPISLKAANEYVAALHRHHKPTQGHKFSIACKDETGAVRGVVIVGRPVSRMLDDGYTAEVTRLCTDGGGTWSRPSRGRTDKHPLEAKQLWSSP